jgi:16S rRNA (cytosine967-C5)-methyltransferase
MKPSAQIQAMIELMDEILLKVRIPADNIISHYFKQHRFAGSHDRRCITETVYSILRAFPYLEKQLKNIDGRSLYFSYMYFFAKKKIEEIKACFNDEPHAPFSLSADEIKVLTSFSKENFPKENEVYLPTWIESHISVDAQKSIFGAMNTNAPFDLRVNTLIANRDEVMRDFFAKGILTKPTPWSPYGIRVDNRRPLANDPLFKNGAVEVQDEGSQVVSLMCDAKPGMSVLDMCAGAGGKTLAMAMTMQNKGIIIATDVVQSRLDQCKKRLRRSGVHNAQTRLIDESWLKRQQARFDRVVVDAPCTGTGTWRRNPDLKIRGSEKTLQELIIKQREILTQAAPLVKIGGRLIYMTCSLLKDENHMQAEWFLANHQNFQMVPANTIWNDQFSIPYPSTETSVLQMTPKDHYTDGFFIAVFFKTLKSQVI